MDNENANDNHSQLAKALAIAQGQIQAATKSSENPAFKKSDGKKSTYADLAEVIAVIQKPASENGLSTIFNFKLDADVMFINYELWHSSGEVHVSTWVPMFLRDKTLHGFGASNTFMRRQLLKAIYQIPEEDDDGNSQSGKGQVEAPKHLKKSENLAKGQKICTHCGLELVWRADKNFWACPDKEYVKDKHSTIGGSTHTKPSVAEKTQSEAVIENDSQLAEVHTSALKDPNVLATAAGMLAKTIVDLEMDEAAIKEAIKKSLGAVKKIELMTDEELHKVIKYLDLRR